VSVAYNCCWASSAQPFSGSSPAGLTTLFYSFRVETPPTWRARSPYLYPSGIGWPSYTPRYWVPFCRLLRLAGLRWRYSNHPQGEASSLKTDCILNNIRNSVRTSQVTHYSSVRKTNQLMLFYEKIAVYCETHTKHTNTFCGQNAEF
jgi:hypothetical protein